MIVVAPRKGLLGSDALELAIKHLFVFPISEPYLLGIQGHRGERNHIVGARGGARFAGVAEPPGRLCVVKQFSPTL